MRTNFIRTLILTSVIALSTEIKAQFFVIEEEPKRLYYDFTAKRITKVKDMKNFRDVFHKDKYLMGKNRITGNISYTTGRVLLDTYNEQKSEIRHALSFYSRIRFWEEFSLNTTFYKDFNKNAAARWVADYSYSIGRYNWRPNKLNFGYENYINNKYSDNLKTFGKKFLEGYYFVSYNHVPKRFNKSIRIDSTSSFRLTYFSRYNLYYRDAMEVTHGGINDGKVTLGAAARYTILWNIYIEGGLYYYPEEHKKLPWDPDYTYGFGYFDYRNFRMSVSYGNWAINRFPWNRSSYARYNFLDGQFKVSLNWMW